MPEPCPTPSAATSAAAAGLHGAAAVVVIAEVPLTPHGKVDTAALPDPGGTARRAGRDPRTPRKRQSPIFAEVAVPGPGRRGRIVL